MQCEITWRFLQLCAYYPINDLSEHLTGIQLAGFGGFDCSDFSNWFHRLLRKHGLGGIARPDSDNTPRWGVCQAISKPRQNKARQFQRL